MSALIHAALGAAFWTFLLIAGAGVGLWVLARRDDAAAARAQELSE
jgi:hypothetical protein